MRRPQGHRRQRRRAGGDDSVHGHFHRFGLGIGLITLRIALARSQLPNYAAIITIWNLAQALGMVMIIAAIFRYFAIRRVLKIEPLDIFHA